MPNIALTRLVVISTCLSLVAVFGANAEDGRKRSADRAPSWAELADDEGTLDATAVQSVAPVAIPDGDDRGTESQVLVQDMRAFDAQIVLRVALHHPRPADLTMVLRNPIGTEVVVWNQQRALPNAVLDFPVEGFAGDKTTNGTWTLMVIDHAQGAQGAVQSWGLTLDRPAHAVR